LTSEKILRYAVVNVGEEIKCVYGIMRYTRNDHGGCVQFWEHWLSTRTIDFLCALIIGYYFITKIRMQTILTYFSIE